MGADKFDFAGALERQQKRSEEARETLAKRMFSDESLNDAMSAGAAAGLKCTVIVPEPKMDVSKTATAKAFVAKLEAAGFRTEWKFRDRQDVAEPWAFLSISWGPGSGKK
jgi:hypothetical protein